MPEVVGQYTLTTVLGGGGMATVYRGEHVSGIGMQAAVKKLHPHLALDARIRKRLRIEAQALVRLQHPNVVRILDFVETEDACALVTELVEGRTLRAVMEEFGRPMPIPQALLLMRQILLGVGHAHKQQCLHRDIKPGNIMVTPDNEVKVLDFGIASLLDRDRMTGTGISLGTPVYMAPEQVEGTEGLDERVDIYSLGVTFWEMLAGPNARPIGAHGWRLRPEHIERLRGQHVPAAVVDVLAAMVEEDRDRRLRSCQEVIQALAWAMEEPSGASVAASSVESTVDDDPSDERTIPMERSGMANLAALPTGPQRPPVQQLSATTADTLKDGTRGPALAPGGTLEHGSTQPWQHPQAAPAAVGPLHAVRDPTPLGPGRGSSRPPAAPSWADVPGPLRPEEISRHEGRPAPATEGGAPTDPQTLHEGTQGGPPRPRRKKRRSRERGPWLFVAVMLVFGLGLAAWVMAPRGGVPLGIKGGETLDGALSALPAVRVFPAGPFPYGPEAATRWLSAFAMERQEVTVGQYRRCMDAEGGPCPDALARYARGGGRATETPPPLENQPIEYVSWDEALRYCRWAYRDAAIPGGFVARLPTDAEWERAARGNDGVGRLYPVGQLLPADLGNTGASTRIPLAGGTARDRTEEGISDLTGGVEEWILDGASGDPVEARLVPEVPDDSRKDPFRGLGPSNSRDERALRAIRGGNYRRHPVVQAALFQSTGRQWVRPSQVAPGRGFRCVVGREHTP